MYSMCKIYVLIESQKMDTNDGLDICIRLSKRH